MHATVPNKRTSTRNMYEEKDVLSPGRRPTGGAINEKELIRRIVEDDDRRSLETVFIMCEGLLQKLARLYCSSLLPYPDAYQVAAVGLMKALRRYDPDRGTAFKSYAYPNIEGELKRFYRDKAEMIRLPRRVWKVKNRMRNAKESSPEARGESLTASRMANILDLTEEEILEAHAADNYLAPISIDRPVYSDSTTQLSSLIGRRDPQLEDLEDSIVLAGAIEKLPDDLRRVVELRMARGFTQDSVAREMGVSQMQVSRLQNRACTMIREYIFPGSSRVAFSDS